MVFLSKVREAVSGRRANTSDLRDEYYQQGRMEAELDYARQRGRESVNAAKVSARRPAQSRRVVQPVSYLPQPQQVVYVPAPSAPKVKHRRHVKYVPQQQPQGGGNSLSDLFGSSGGASHMESILGGGSPQPAGRKRQAGRSSFEDLF